MYRHATQREAHTDRIMHFFDDTFCRRCITASGRLLLLHFQFMGALNLALHSTRVHLEQQPLASHQQPLICLAPSRNALLLLLLLVINRQRDNWPPRHIRTPTEQPPHVVIVCVTCMLICKVQQNRTIWKIYKEEEPRRPPSPHKPRFYLWAKNWRAVGKVHGGRYVEDKAGKNVNASITIFTIYLYSSIKKHVLLMVSISIYAYQYLLFLQSLCQFVDEGELWLKCR